MRNLLFSKIEVNLIDSQEPDVLAHLISLLSQREDFTLSDTYGNIDGSTENSLKMLCLEKLMILKENISEQLNFLKPELISVNEYSFDFIDCNESY